MKPILAIPAFLAASITFGALSSVISTPARSADYSAEVALKINRVYAKPVSYLAMGRPTIIVTLTNRSAHPLSIIAIDCAFLMDGTPVATAMGGASNVSVGSSAIEEVFTMKGVAFDSATCRVSAAIR